MMAKQQDCTFSRTDLKTAFRCLEFRGYSPQSRNLVIYRIFDDNDDGRIHASDLVEVQCSYLGAVELVQTSEVAFGYKKWIVLGKG